MKVWVLRGNGITVWSSEEKAKAASLRQQLASQEANLVDALETIKRNEAWRAWLAFEVVKPPAQTVHDTVGLDPDTMTDAERTGYLRKVHERLRAERERARGFRTRITRLKQGADYGEQWGFAIETWTVDTDEAQGERY